MIPMVRSASSLVRRSSGALALAILALVSLGIFLALASMLIAQRDTARIVVFNEAQIVRTQRVAFLAFAARDRNVTPTWRAELHQAIDKLLRVRKILADRHDLAPVPVDATGHTPVTHAITAYAEAATALESDPNDAASLSYIISHRHSLVALQEQMVNARTQIVEDRLTRILDVAVLSIAVMLASLWLMWARIIASSERRMASLVANLHSSREEIKSLFRENPDPIAIWDLDGRLVRGNAASSMMLELDASALGSHFLEHVIASDAPVALAAFDRTKRGERVGFETTFVTGSREKIDVSVSLFPKITDGEIRGVIGVAKDCRALRRAEVAYELQTERITELCRIFTYQNKPALLQIEETLAVATQRLGYDWAIAFDKVDGDFQTIGMVRNGNDASLASRDDLTAFAKDFLVREDDVWSIDHIATGRTFAPRAMAGAPITIGSATSGLLVLGSSTPRAEKMPNADRDFLRLVSALVGAAVQRGHHERKLDTLAFFDTLTALPNRASLSERLETLLSESQQYERHFAVHCLDLDRFKAINDEFGHAVGDDVLNIAARRMERCLRSTDTVARIGGDEFVILQVLDGDMSAVAELADRIIDSVAQPMAIDGIEHVVGISVGISVFPKDGTDAKSLIHAADEALLRAKREGRNRRTTTIAGVQLAGRYG